LAEGGELAHGSRANPAPDAGLLGECMSGCVLALAFARLCCRFLGRLWLAICVALRCFGLIGLWLKTMTRIVLVVVFSLWLRCVLVAFKSLPPLRLSLGLLERLVLLPTLPRM
jgi:hypothetical protein